MKFLMTLLILYTLSLWLTVSMDYLALCYTESLQITTGICYPLSLYPNEFDKLILNKVIF